MGLLWLALMQVRVRLLTHLLSVLVIGIALALAIATSLLARGVQRGVDQAAGPFDLMIGAKGSAQQLILSSVLLQGNPLENLSFAVVRKLIAHPGVASAIPFAYGDSVAGMRIIGTVPEFFDVRTRPTAPPYFRIVQGRAFAGPFEAVVGSVAATRIGLQVGATFQSAHGDEPELPGEADDDDAHRGRPYRVVGILAPTESPADRAVYVSLESYWEIHASQTRGQVEPRGPEVSAVLVKPKLFPQDVFRVQQSANTGAFGPGVQGVVPYQELARLNRLVGQGQQVLGIMSVVALLIASSTVFLAMVSSVNDRRRDLAILRAIGATRRHVLGVVLAESLVIVGLGVMIGVAGGVIGALVVGQSVTEESNVRVLIGLTWNEPVFVGAIVVLGAVAGLLPAVIGARRPVADALSAT